jgi:hypothetical protein
MNKGYSTLSSVEEGDLTQIWSTTTKGRSTAVKEYPDGKAIDFFLFFIISEAR